MNGYEKCMDIAARWDTNNKIEERQYKLGMWNIFVNSRLIFPLCFPHAYTAQLR